MHTKNMKLETFTRETCLEVRIHRHSAAAGRSCCCWWSGYRRIELCSGGTTKNLFVSGRSQLTLSFRLPKKKTSRLWKRSSEPGRKSLHRATKWRTNSNASGSAKKYQEMHRLVREPDGSTVLYIGAENWPFPIPLVSKNGAWYFDSKTGIAGNSSSEESEKMRPPRSKSARNSPWQRSKARHVKRQLSDDPISQYAQSLSFSRCDERRQQ